MSNLSGTFDDIGHAIAQMGRLSDSATELSDQLQAMLDDIKVTLPKALPFVIAGGALLGTYLVTGIVRNIKEISVR